VFSLLRCVLVPFPNRLVTLTSSHFFLVSESSLSKWLKRKFYWWRHFWGKPCTAYRV